MEEKQASLIRKYHNHELQINPRHCERKQHNNHNTTGRQTKQSNQLSLSCPMKMIAKLEKP